MVLSTGHTFGHLKRKLTLNADAPKNLFLTKETRNVLQHFSETNKTIHFECILKGLSSVKEQSYYNSRMIACNTVNKYYLFSYHPCPMDELCQASIHPFKTKT